MSKLSVNNRGQTNDIVEVISLEILRSNDYKYFENFKSIKPLLRFLYQGSIRFRILFSRNLFKNPKLAF